MRPSRSRSAVAAAVVLAGVLAGIAAPASAGWWRARRHYAPAGPLVPGWHDDLTVESGGLLRYFRVYVPQGLAPGAPLVILLHGGSQSMRKIFGPNAGGTNAWPGLADASGFLLVAPNGVNASTGSTSGDNQNWNDCRGDMTAGNSGADDVGFIGALIDQLRGTYATDPARVYVTGASNGGMMTFRVAIELGDRIAGAAAFIAGMPAVNQCRAPLRPVPMLIVDGTADPYVPWAGGPVAGSDSGHGAVVSAADTLAYWQAADHAATAAASTVALPDGDPADGSTVSLATYPELAGGAPVEFATVTGGGHTMPSVAFPVPAVFRVLLGLGGQNQDVEGAELAWSFLRSQRLP